MRKNDMEIKIEEEFPAHEVRDNDAEMQEAITHVRSLSLKGVQQVPKDVSGIEYLIEEKYLEK